MECGRLACHSSGMATSDRDGMKPPGWQVRVELSDKIEGRPITTFYLARLSSPTDAERAVRAQLNIPPEREVTAMREATKEQLDRAGVPYGEARI